MENVHQLPAKRLLGKVAIITGGARGIGAATARLFAENGAHVIIADILDDLGAALADTIGARYIHCDVARESDVEAAVQLALTCHGQLDVMFNNAGIAGPSGSIADVDMGEVRALLAVNLDGVVHGMKHAARAMTRKRRRHGGSIICSTSTAGTMGGLAAHAYTISKGAVAALARSAACELGRHGVRVNCVSPHGVPSEMLVGAFRRHMGTAGRDVGPAEVGEMVAEWGSLLRGRVATAEDVARAALFLAGDEAAYITGHNLVVDGGYTSACSHLEFIYRSKEMGL